MASQSTTKKLPIAERQGPYSMEKIRRVDHPTSLITDHVQRIDQREIAYELAARGDYGPVVQKNVKKSLPGKYPLSAAQKDIIDYLALIPPNPVASMTAPIPDDPPTLTRHIKSVGYFLGADIMGTCKVPESAYYSHDKQGRPIEPRFENAVLLVMGKDSQAVHASSGRDWMGDPISFQAYDRLGMAAEILANYIRRLGWEAAPQYGPSFVGKYSVLIPPLLLASGIGEVSRVGIILNPYLGLGYKAAAVLTDMPLVPDQPVDFGLQRFCADCKICADSCPSKAVSKGDQVMYNGYSTWKLDTQRCASVNFSNKTGTMCNRCVKSCPWTRPAKGVHRIVRELAIQYRFAQWAAVKAAPLLGAPRSYPEEKWWLDVEYEDGILISTEQG